MLFRSDEYCSWLAEQLAFNNPPRDASCEYLLDPAPSHAAGPQVPADAAASVKRPPTEVEPGAERVAVAAA